MNRENKPLFLYTFITVFGGLIVGLNMAGISGAVPFLQEQFMLDDMALGLVVSILTVGCLCGALLGGGFSDRYGRQKVMFSSAVFFIVSSFIQRIIHTFHLYQLINHACQHSDLLNIESHFMPP